MDSDEAEATDETSKLRHDVIRLNRKNYALEAQIEELTRKQVRSQEGEGSHLMLDCVGCDVSKLSDPEFLSDFVGRIIEQDLRSLVVVGPEVEEVEGMFVSFAGNAAVHVSVHAFPDTGWAFVDVFSCSSFDHAAVEDTILHSFNVSEYERHHVSRGRLFRPSSV